MVLESGVSMANQKNRLQQKYKSIPKIFIWEYCTIFPKILAKKFWKLLKRGYLVSGGKKYFDFCAWGTLFCKKISTDRACELLYITPFSPISTGGVSIFYRPIVLHYRESYKHPPPPQINILSQGGRQGRPPYSITLYFICRTITLLRRTAVPITARLSYNIAREKTYSVIVRHKMA